MREHKSLAASVKAASEGEGIVEAVVSVFGNIDSYGERVMPGAFTKSLERKLPVGVLAHDWSNPIATTLEVRELEAGDPLLPDNAREHGGLWIKGQFFQDIHDSWEAYKKIARGLFREFSIGYNVVSDGWNEGVRELNELELHEWSPVLVGANPATSLLGIKSASFDGHVEALDTEVNEIIERMLARESMRIKAGRVLSARNIATLAALADSLGKARKEIIRLINDAAPEPKGHNAHATRLLIAQTILNEALNDH